MDKIISALNAVGQEKESFVKLRELQLIIQEAMQRRHDQLWMLYPLNEIIEEFFYSIEGVDLSNNSELSEELGNFRNLVADLEESIRSGNLEDQTKNMNGIINSYVDITNLS